MSEVQEKPAQPVRCPETGRFLTSGNPAGRPPGARNRSNLVKEFIEEKLTNELEEEAVEVLHVAIRKAKAGDNAMIKLLLGDMLSATRNGTAEGEDANKGGITVTINNLTRDDAKPVAEVTLDHSPDEEDSDG